MQGLVSIPCISLLKTLQGNEGEKSNKKRDLETLKALCFNLKK